MTYILTDSELNTLVGFYGILPDSLSPYKISPEARTDETLSSLQKTGLVEHSENEFYLSEDGRVIAELLAAPGVCVKFIKKTDGTSVTVFVDDPSESKVWCVCVRTSDPTVNILKIFLSKDSAVNFLRKEIFVPKTEFTEDFDIDLFLTYEEWVMFGLSQLCYMRLQSAGELYFDSENEWLSDRDIFSEKFLAFLAQNTEINMDAFSTVEKRVELYTSLCDKGVLVRNPENWTFKYSDSTKIWLDNDVSYDSVKVVYSNIEGAAYTLMLTLRVNGVTSMHDTGDGVRIVSSKTIPFSAYLS